MRSVPFEPKKYTPASVFTLVLLLILHEGAVAKTKVYVVHLGRRQHEDLDLLTRTHHELLTSVLGSDEASEDSMIYSYKHGFSGFAAKLTETQAKVMSELPAVASVIPNYLYKLQTTRSWDYLGFALDFPTDVLHESTLAHNLTIGLFDGGIWPESEVFNDKGLGPIPSRWKGTCDPGEFFDPVRACNRKLIGARHYVKGLEAEYVKPLNTSGHGEYLSPRDGSGHGTHASTIAGGSITPGASFHGLGFGTVRGGAPSARLAMYKVCWNVLGGVCATADVLKAFDDAIQDGVDVISLSLAPEIPSFSDVDKRSPILFGSFHAVLEGIVVVCAGGNDGPSSQTVQNAAPWVITVAASSMDRSFPTTISLGNNQTIMGQGHYTGKDVGFLSLVYPEVSDLNEPRYCSSLSESDVSWLVGKVVLCFTSESGVDAITYPGSSVKEAGGLGLIVAKRPTASSYSCGNSFPCVQVSYEFGFQILSYIRSTRFTDYFYSSKSIDPCIRISPSQTRVGKPLPANVAYFSSRGPNSIAPAILKPDIAAPGVKILAAVPPDEKSSTTNTSFRFLSGTSMATPHISGIVALLKSLHPEWSPAAIKSAVITTARTTGLYGEPLYAEGDPMKLADPFDFGGGIVDPNRAADPGLVYDMGESDYIDYLCAMSYNDSSISRLRGHRTSCLGYPGSILDINLPSISIPHLEGSATLRRTVTNVGPINSTYNAVVQSPPGVTTSVEPDTLTFNAEIKEISFRLMVSAVSQVYTGYGFGSLTWTDGVHSVRSPIAVQVGGEEFYD
ncbi:subtilisin-like protease SBT3.9 isoform X1 [Punica granatum]|uniref:Subtilisin-like protease SBT3.9 isoform X1 n=1 Tax=Punica granatum TaxID=22663 RepID=A0A6P8C870_PUNGR|nr:subtilisin-like protease SBT3.9 isoform X1 [Punica granatum]